MAIEEAQKPQQQRDLEEAQRIITARLQAGSVSQDELDWASALCAREAKTEQEELEQAQAAEARKLQYHQEQQRRYREIMAANQSPEWTARMLTRAYLGEGDNEDSEDDSDLSSVASDISALNPDRSPQTNSAKGKKTRANKKTAAKKPTDEEVSPTTTPSLPQHFTNMCHTQEGPKSALGKILRNLQFEARSKDAPGWIEWFTKPLPHPLLNVLQNEYVMTRLWHDEIARLEKLYTGKPPPDGHPAGGHWIYMHMNRTIRVTKDTTGGDKAITFARGWWSYGINTDFLGDLPWDENPVGVDGKPVGWMEQKLGYGRTRRLVREDWLEEEMVAAGLGEVEEDGAEGVEGAA
jgi:hypothetical protein